MGFEKNRFKVRAKPFNIGSIIFDLSFTPLESPLLGAGMIKRILVPYSGWDLKPHPF